MRLARPFGLLALAALLARPAEASVPRGGVALPPSCLEVAPLAEAALAPSVLDEVARLDTPRLPLFDGDELAQALDLDGGDLGEGLAVVDIALASRARDTGFHPLQSLDLLADEPLRSPLESYPENRIRTFELSAPFRVGVEPKLSLWSHQACGFSCPGLASVGREDPLGLAGDEPGFWNRIFDWIGNTPPARKLKQALGIVHEGSENVGTLTEQKYRQALQTGPVDPANDEMLRQADYDPRSVTGVQGGLQAGRAGKEAFKNKTSDIVQKGTSLATEQLVYFGATKALEGVGAGLSAEAKGVPKPRQPGSEVALGLNQGGKQLKKFARKVEASTYEDWLRTGLSTADPDRPGQFGLAFYEATFRSERIHFNLDSLNLKTAWQEGQLYEPGAGRMTSWELVQIVQHKDLLGKTTFYQNGVVVPTERLLQRLEQAKAR